MKIKILISSLFLAAAALVSLNFSTENSMGGWERLGSRKVNFRLDRDEIEVTAAEGKFSALKIDVRGGALNMHKIAVHFGNGEVENLEVRHNFGRGSASRVIDLPGNKRFIKKVVFWYDTDNDSRRRATLTLFGKH